MNEAIKSVQPKCGKNHRFFGSRYLKMHNMRDPKWTTQDKFTQYIGLTTLHEKDQKLAALARSAELKKRLRHIQTLRKQVSNDREALKMAVYGDSQLIKNILQNHKDLQRLYQNMPSHLIIENMDQRTFVKRKELDRLICKRNQLTAKYEYDLTEFSKLQDRMQFEAGELKDDFKVRFIRMELKNSETRLKAVKTINQAYEKVIENMTKDSLYFHSVLDALQEDIQEQQDFINTTIRLGRPALANLEKLHLDYKKLDNQTQAAFAARLATLKKYYNVIDENNIKVKTLCRRDSDFEIFPNRYQRETKEMTDMKNQLQKVEEMMKLVKITTSCVDANDVYPRVKNLYRDNVRLNKVLEQKERERKAAIERDEHAQIKKEQLYHNLTDEEIRRVNMTAELGKDAATEVEEQQKLENTIQSRNELISMLKMSFQHLVDVLRHVGEINRVARKPYTNVDLSLPLLKFTAMPSKVTAPPPFEEDVDTLLHMIRSRVGILMQKYDEEKSAEELLKGFNYYHDAIRNDVRDEEGLAFAVLEDEPVDEIRAVMEDPLIPTRKKLKAIAVKIVEANTKTDD